MPLLLTLNTLTAYKSIKTLILRVLMLCMQYTLTH